MGGRKDDQGRLRPANPSRQTVYLHAIRDHFESFGERLAARLSLVRVVLESGRRQRAAKHRIPTLEGGARGRLGGMEP